MGVDKGTIVGLEKDGFVLVRVQGIRNPLRVNVTSLERVTSGLASGDWVRLLDGNRDWNHSSVGILHAIDRDGSVSVGFLGLETLWKGHCDEVQMAEPYSVGQFVRIKGNVISPRFLWVSKRNGTWATGKVLEIYSNGCLVVDFPGRFGSRMCLADPGEVERVSFETCLTLVDKFEHVEDFHWAVRPVVVAVGVVTAMKFGFFVGRSVGGRLKKSGGGGGGRKRDGGGGGEDGRNSGGKKWLPSPVANMLSREGGAPPVTGR